MRPAFFLTILLMLLSGVAGYFIGTNNIAMSWQAYKPQLNITSKEAPPGVTNLDMTQFWVVLQKLEQNYYDKSVFKPQDLVNGAISGMVSSINDPYTMYLPPKNNTDFKQQIAGKFEGIGAELGMKDKQVIIVAPLDGSPSQKAGLRAGDAVIKVDNKPIYGEDLGQVVDKIRGPKGSTVTLTIVHKDALKEIDVPIVRDTINVKSVFSWVKQVKDVDAISQTAVLKKHPTTEVAYIRLSQFGEQTNQEWSTIVSSLALKLQQDKQIKGVILDLRNNPGGLLTDAVYIASEFLKDGVVVQEDDGKGNRQALSVNRQGLLTDIPLLVLINKGSASASEIVSGALRDHQRVKLVGEQSFGKGTVQEAEDLGGGAGLHVTIAKWLTPNGTWVHMKGLTPDISVDLDQKDLSHDTQLEKAVETLVQ